MILESSTHLKIIGLLFHCFSFKVILRTFDVSQKILQQRLIGYGVMFDRLATENVNTFST